MKKPFKRPQPKPCGSCGLVESCDCYLLHPGERHWWVRVIGTAHFHGPLFNLRTDYDARMRGAVIFGVEPAQIEAVYRPVRKKETTHVDKFAALGDQSPLS